MSQINKGADLLLHVADTSGNGVIQAAKEKGYMHLAQFQTRIY
jgi:basic membrane protein A and related proteins